MDEGVGELARAEVRKLGHQAHHSITHLGKVHRLKGRKRGCNGKGGKEGLCGGEDYLTSCVVTSIVLISVCTCSPGHYS